jgi:hypothetical protein
MSDKKQLFAPLKRGVKLPLCCQQLCNAFECGTDNEAYGSLASNYGETLSSITIGCELPEIVFCPWCGTRLDSIKGKWQPASVSPRKAGNYEVEMDNGEIKQSYFASMFFEGETKWSIETDEGGSVSRWRTT